MLTIESVERLFLEQKRRVEGLADLCDLLKKYPEMLDDLAGLLAARKNEIATTGASVGRPARSGTAYQRIASTFMRHDNEWLDTGAISRESNVSRNAVASVLWSLHKGDFQKMDHATHKRMKVWRMTPERFDAIKSQNRLFEDKSESTGNLVRITDALPRAKFKNYRRSGMVFVASSPESSGKGAK